MALIVNNSPANAGDIRDLGLNPGWGRSLGEGMAPHSSILAWIILWWATVHGVARVRHDLTTKPPTTKM